MQGGNGLDAAPAGKVQHILVPDKVGVQLQVFGNGVASGPQKTPPRQFIERTFVVGGRVEWGGRGNDAEPHIVERVEMDSVQCQQLLGVVFFPPQRQFQKIVGGIVKEQRFLKTVIVVRHSDFVVGVVSVLQQKRGQATVFGPCKGGSVDPQGEVGAVVVGQGWSGGR